MINRFTSNSLRNLFSSLCEKFTDSKRERNPLVSTHFVLPNNDMGRWLQIELARMFGISSNLLLEMPSSYMRRYYTAIDPDYGQRLADKEDITWIIHDLLKGAARKERSMEPVLQYIAVGGRDEEALRRRQMAARIADMFDQYFIYRPEWLEAWAEGRQHKDCKKLVHAKWQKWLWQRIRRDFPELQDRAFLQRQLTEKIESGELDGELPDHLFVFGIPVMAPVFMRTIFVMSQRKTTVNWYQLVPAESFDDAPLKARNNPVLNNLAREHEESATLFTDFAEEYSVKISKQDNPVYPETDKLLHQLQRKILSIENPGKIQEKGVDNSIGIHSCHSALRETEVLYDQILEYLNNNSARGPGDILVMLPDIAEYAPFIEAVFGAPEDEELQIPYTLSDPQSGAESEMAHLFLQVLQVAAGRFRITEVMELLDTQPVREIFGFSEQDVALLEKWVTETNVRWGWDRDHHAGSYQNSWQFGLHRLFAGLAFDPETNTPVSEVLPYDEIEGGNVLHLLGIFRHFLEQLNQTRQSLSGEHKPQEWGRRMSNVLENFLPENQDNAGGIQNIREQIRKLEHMPEKWGIDDRVPFEWINDWFTQTLESDRLGPGFRSGKVTFSAMVPVRGIPFPFIAVMGMNNQQIPGKDAYSGFDLMGQTQRKGDRSRRLQDRAVFLDTLLTAGEVLCLTYTGQDQKNNAEIPPSTLVTELLDYIDSQYVINQKRPSETLVVKHPLYGFNSRYFDQDDAELFSFSRLYARASEKAAKSEKTTWFAADKHLPLDNEYKYIELSLTELIRFFQKPLDQLLRKRFEIRIREEEVISEDRDIWKISGLQGYKIRKELLDAILATSDPDPVYRYFRAEGSLPREEIREYHFNNLTEEIRTFVNELEERQVIQPYKEAIEWDKEFDTGNRTVRLYGKLENLTDSGNLFILNNSVNAKFKLMAWIYHLALQIAEPRGCGNETTLVMREKGKPKIFRYHPVDEPLKLMTELLEDYIEGLENPFTAYPQSSEVYVKESDNPKQIPEGALRKAKIKMDSDYNFPERRDDPAIDYLFSERDIIDVDFSEKALRLWQPIKNHQEEMK